ncbi:hypothetical protein [Klebsiella quasipneumoniae]|uniref:hypothetical protein n=1 Tax=Klebsiella quasipneumoniae TaxID=1463165 RepID=UPI0023B0F4F7|nr:hypothetical protein [Klebsiella quasipneumoniae]
MKSKREIELEIELAVTRRALLNMTITNAHEKLAVVEETLQKLKTEYEEFDSEGHIPSGVDEEGQSE